MEKEYNYKCKKCGNIFEIIINYRNTEPIPGTMFLAYKGYNRSIEHCVEKYCQHCNYLNPINIDKLIEVRKI